MAAGAKAVALLPFLLVVQRLLRSTLVSVLPTTPTLRIQLKRHVVLESAHRRPRRQRMHHVDRIPNVQRLAQPPWHRRPRVQNQAIRLIPRSQYLDGVAQHLGWSRDLREDPPVRMAELKLAIRLSFDLVASS